MNTYVISDIHGKLTMLDNLIAKIPYKTGDKFIFLGDYIDRGEESCGVIDYLIKFSSSHDCVFLKGNHEDMFMDFLSGINLEIFLYNGGVETLKSYGVTDYYNIKLPVSHMYFFDNLLDSYEDDDYIYVHGGINPYEFKTKGMKQDSRYLLWIRDPFIDSKMDFGKKVIFGHTPFELPLVMDNKIGIDTGAFYYGCLTCLVLPDETFIHEFSRLETKMRYAANKLKGV